MLVNLFN